MTFIPPQDWSGAPAPIAPTTTPARFGKMGFWIGMGAIAVNVISTIAYVIGFAPPEGQYRIIADLIGFLVWGSLLAATTLGIIGIVKRERPIIWSILATGVIVIHSVLMIAVGIISTVFLVAAFVNGGATP